MNICVVKNKNLLARQERINPMKWDGAYAVWYKKRPLHELSDAENYLYSSAYGPTYGNIKDFSIIPVNLGSRIIGPFRLPEDQTSSQEMLNQAMPKALSLYYEVLEDFRRFEYNFNDRFHNNKEKQLIMLLPFADLKTDERAVRPLLSINFTGYFFINNKEL